MNVEMRGLENLDAETVYIEFMGTSSAVRVVRGRGGMPLPIGCPTISVPADGHWFAGLFPMLRTIIRVDHKKLFACVSGFLPHLAKHKMAVSSISIDSFCIDDEGSISSTFQHVSWTTTPLQKFWARSLDKLRIFFQKRARHNTGMP